MKAEDVNGLPQVPNRMLFGLPECRKTIENYFFSSFQWKYEIGGKVPLRQRA